MGGAGLEIGGSGDPVIGASELTDDNSMAIGMGILISAFAINHARIVEGGEFLCNTIREIRLKRRRFSLFFLHLLRKRVVRFPLRSPLFLTQNILTVSLAYLQGVGIFSRVLMNW
jgi:hypothetical protein